MCTASAIIIPTYRGEHFLPRALQSLRNQTRQDFEVIVVSDDGADYLPLAKSFLGKQVSQAFTPMPGSGPAIARMTGVRVTTAPVIGFLDVDDEYAPRRLERLIPLALQHGAVTSNLRRIDDATKVFINDSCPHGMPRGGLLKEKHVPWLDGPLSPLVRRDCLPEYPDMWLFEDLFFLLRVIGKVGSLPVIHDSDALYLYLVQKKSLSYGTERDELTTRTYASIIQQAKNGGPLFRGVTKAAQDAFFHCFRIRAMRSHAYDVAKITEPGLDFQTFSPRFDHEMAGLAEQVPSHLRAWA